MTTSARHDAWAAGDSYDAYMGRWSRVIAPHFLEWLALPAGLDWLDVGCGTGALSETILSRCAPARLRGIDPASAFVARAAAHLADDRASFAVGDAQALAAADGAYDVAVSGLVLNFVPDRPRALREMRRTVRPGGVVAFYVWDYPGGGVQFMRAFWDAAIALDPPAADLGEARRFPFCTPEGLRQLCGEAGLGEAELGCLQAESLFRDFDDYWRPFTLGAGPAPGYCASLPEAARVRLRETLRARLPAADDGALSLALRAWCVKAVVA
jgi:SAM-dependent methyltransferase